MRYTLSAAALAQRRLPRRHTARALKRMLTGSVAGGITTGQKPENLRRITAWLNRIDRSEVGRYAGHVRHHVNEGRTNPAKCKYCRGEETESFLLDPDQPENIALASPENDAVKAA